LRLELDRLIEVGNRLVALALLLQRIAAIEIGRGAQLWLLLRIVDDVTAALDGGIGLLGLRAERDVAHRRLDRRGLGCGRRLLRAAAWLRRDARAMPALPLWRCRR